MFLLPIFICQHFVKITYLYLQIFKCCSDITLCFHNLLIKKLLIPQFSLFYPLFYLYNLVFHIQYFFIIQSFLNFKFSQFSIFTILLNNNLARSPFIIFSACCFISCAFSQLSQFSSSTITKNFQHLFSSQIIILKIQYFFAREDQFAISVFGKITIK